MTSHQPSQSAIKQLQRRVTSAHDWIPDQPGAWAMALLPSIAGVIIGGANITTLWLLAAWILCYCVQFTAARWMKSHYARRYAPPVLIYTVLLALVGLPFVIIHPGILRWAPLYIVLAAASFAAAWLRRERSLWGNAVAIVAACIMTTIIISFAGPQISCAPQIAACLAHARAEFDQFARHLPTIATWWSPLALPAIGIIASVMFALEQFGSVLFVKTMIRERGNRTYQWASWLWHAVLFGIAILASLFSLGWITAIPVIVTNLWLLARAIALPILARRRTIKPIVTGMVEMVSSLLIFVTVIVIL
ncbi:YwiC-like family protein [Bifidobacterium hapali]|nr:YwiC-like family protein [Bifidobacterium hapali]